MKKRRGVSLIELVLTVALLGLVIQVVYSVFFVGSTSYSVSTNKGFSQQDVRIAVDFITKELSTATEIGVNLENKNGFFSLEIESDGTRSKLVKYYNQLDDKGTPDTGDDILVKNKISSFSGNWQNIELSNTLPGIVTGRISQEEGTGRGKSSYVIDFNIELINNPSEVDAFVTTNLVNSNKLYYRNEPINLKVNGIHVKPGSLDLGDVLRTLIFKDSSNIYTVYKTFTAVKGTPIEKPLNPERDGYTFAGWFTATDDSGAEYTSWSEMPDYDFTLFAKWHENSPTPPIVNSVKIIQIEAKNKSPHSVSILPNNSNPLMFEKNKEHKITIEILGSNLDKITVKVNANSPIIEYITGTKVVVKYSFTTPNTTGNEVIRVVLNENNSNLYLFNYSVVNSGDY